MFNTLEDVIEFAKKFGRGALEFAVKNSTVSPDEARLIINTFSLKQKSTIEIDSFNDGNTEWSVDARVKISEVCGIIVDEIEVVGSGRKNFRMSLIEALKACEITKEQAERALSFKKLVVNAHKYL